MALHTNVIVNDTSNMKQHSAKPREVGERAPVFGTSDAACPITARERREPGPSDASRDRARNGFVAKSRGFPSCATSAALFRTAPRTNVIERRGPARVLVLVRWRRSYHLTLQRGPALPKRVQPRRHSQDDVIILSSQDLLVFSPLSYSSFMSVDHLKYVLSRYMLHSWSVRNPSLNRRYAPVRNLAATTASPLPSLSPTVNYWSPSRSRPRPGCPPLFCPRSRLCLYPRPRSRPVSVCTLVPDRVSVPVLAAVRNLAAAPSLSVLVRAHAVVVPALYVFPVFTYRRETIGSIIHRHVNKLNKLNQ